MCYADRILLNERLKQIETKIKFGQLSKIITFCLRSEAKSSDYQHLKELFMG